MNRFDLVIFDCDGVLVDSERLAVRTEAEILTGLGWPLTETDIVERFVGRSAAYMHQEIERQLGRSIDWDAEFERQYDRSSSVSLHLFPVSLRRSNRYRYPAAWHRVEVTKGCVSPWD